MTASTRRRSGRSISTMAAPCRRWSISLTASTASSRASCRSPRPWRWSASGNGATGSNLDYVQNTVAHLTEMGLAIASSRSWRAFAMRGARAPLSTARADERQLVARLLDRQAEPLAQHDPALGRQRHGERVQGALARVGGQRRQLMLEPARRAARGWRCTSARSSRTPRSSAAAASRRRSTSAAGVSPRSEHWLMIMAMRSSSEPRTC